MCTNTCTIRFETLGCRLNQIESESAANFFTLCDFDVKMGGVTSSSPEDCDTLLCIVNTCAVTQKAEQKGRRIIRLLLKKYPQSVILVTGCYAQLAPAQILEMDKRIVVLAGQLKSRIAQIPLLLKAFLKENIRDSEWEWDCQRFIELLNNQIINKKTEKEGFAEDSFRLATTNFLSHSRASIKIQDGCNNNCSFCTIHIARGHSVSIDVKTALSRVIELEKAGHKEVVITGVNLGQYKSQYNGETYDFARLIKAFLENTKQIRFRISSLYPETITDDFCKIISDDRICPHFHLSVQSGSDKILKLMNRNYDSRTVAAACEKLRKTKNNPFIACDIITGFPGETREDFFATMDLIKECNFAWVHAFPFSERPGTPAVKMKDKVPQSLSGERAELISRLAVTNKIAYIDSLVQSSVCLPAVLETLKNENTENDRYIYHAVTDNFIHCQIESKSKLEECSLVKLKLISSLPEKIIKGGEVEAKALILNY
ncbi:MAG: tRNA (N(6)-L-threonylcarbamoyladenosine(37)-C(2))-methylthiotransferase MtaB [Treponema sp.]|nr:tRNA (N(6)-L-threonylcarbamoyladenosine(37)-C(2))-methylthiotransferase MtaB [Treponema sp.]